MANFKKRNGKMKCFFSNASYCFLCLRWKMSLDLYDVRQNVTICELIKTKCLYLSPGMLFEHHFSGSDSGYLFKKLKKINK